MIYIVIEGPNGQRKVKEGVSYTLAPGERVVRSESVDPPDRSIYLLDKLAGYFGIAVADLIKYAALAFGIEPCPTCEMRYKILNVIAEIGLFKAIRLLYKTIRGRELSEAESAQVLASFKPGS